MNHITLSGNLGRDPEKRDAKGTPLLVFSLAVDDGYWDKKTETRVERTQWVDIEIWGRRANPLGDILRKGNRVWIEGKLCIDKYIDKEGQNRLKTKVKAHNVELVPRAQQRETQSQGFDKPDTGDSFGDSDDLPF